MSEGAAKRFMYPSTVALEALARASAAAAKARAAALDLSTYASFQIQRNDLVAFNIKPLVNEFPQGFGLMINNIVSAAKEAVEAITAYLSIVEGVAKRSGVPGAERLARVSKVLLRRYLALSAAQVRLWQKYGSWRGSGAPNDPEMTELAIEAIRKAVNFGLYVPVAVEEITTVARELGLLGRVKETPEYGEPLGFSGSEGGQA